MSVIFLIFIDKSIMFCTDGKEVKINSIEKLMSTSKKTKTIYNDYK
jgi:hypothetical protein